MRGGPCPAGPSGKLGPWRRGLNWPSCATPSRLTKTAAGGKSDRPFWSRVTADCGGDRRRKVEEAFDKQDVSKQWTFVFAPDGLSHRETLTLEILLYRFGILPERTAAPQSHPSRMVGSDTNDFL
eukprot:COSAG05_NODE_43_length_25931_cov_49.314636_24_plen_125_part_00